MAAILEMGTLCRATAATNMNNRWGAGRRMPASDLMEAMLHETAKCKRSWQCTTAYTHMRMRQ